MGLRVFLVGVVAGESAVKSITSVEPAEAAEVEFTRLRAFFTGVAKNLMSSSASRFLLVADRVLPGATLYIRPRAGEEPVIIWQDAVVRVLPILTSSRSHVHSDSIGGKMG